MSDEFICAVDVGTASARAGIFDRAGRMLARAEHAIRLNLPEAQYAEHDSEDIWRAVCAAVRDTVARSGIQTSSVKAIGFDATCSLVLRRGDGGQLGLGTENGGNWDTISWFDHRALAEADECTRSGHDVLRFIGGAMSPEMQTPKLMWLKQHRPDLWAASGYFFDLADFLTWRATGQANRSQCTLTCKWAYLAHDGGWRPDFFEAVGIGDVMQRAGLPDAATPIGTGIGPLTSTAAADLGLSTDCWVGAGLIDAYAGMLGVLGAQVGDHSDRHMGLVAGTSSCVMALSSQPHFIPSIWGPSLGVTLPEFWSIEAGQSATGALLDHIIRIHAKGGEPTAERHRLIVERIQVLYRVPGFAADIHVLPDFNGNRSPLADPRARGVIQGLTLDASFDGLCALYWRACVSIALGVRQILEHLNKHGFRIDTLHVAGGHTRNDLLMELYADATGVAVTQASEDAVLLGTAAAAATARGWYASVQQACTDMSGPRKSRLPDIGKAAGYEADYAVFLTMQRQRRELANLTSTARLP